MNISKVCIITAALLINISVPAMDSKKQQQQLNKQLFEAVSGPKDLEGKVAVLLAQGANPNIHQFDPPLDKALTAQDQQDTSLHIAIRNGHLKSVEFLLIEKANVHAQNIDGSTPLHETIWLPIKKAQQAIQLLYEYGADIDAQDEDGNTLLHLAIQRKQFAIADTLLDLKANINAQNKKGNTALHETILNDNKEGCRYLLRKEALITIQNKNKLLPYQLAQKSGKFYFYFLLNKLSNLFFTKQTNQPE